MRDFGLRVIMLQPVIILSQLIAITLTVEAPNVALNSELDNATSATGLPYFAKNEHSTTLRVQLGSTAQLHCQVFRVQEKTVSWSRRRGDTIHLLTVGFNTYYKDNRFSLHFEEPHDWKLQIRYVQQRDEGVYECQVSSHPPLIRNVTLQVVNPSMKIVDVRGVLLQEKFYQSGSTIEMQCVVHDVPSVPTLHLAWYKGPDRLNYDTMRGGVSVKTDIRHETVTSWLRVNQAVPSDTGNYTCLLRNVVSASVIVHVLNDEYPAAMQHASNTSSAVQDRPCTVVTALGIVSIYALHHATHAQQVILPWIIPFTNFLERFFYSL